MVYWFSAAILFRDKRHLTRDAIYTLNLRTPLLLMLLEQIPLSHPAYGVALSSVEASREEGVGIDANICQEYLGSIN